MAANTATGSAAALTKAVMTVCGEGFRRDTSEHYRQADASLDSEMESAIAVETLSALGRVVAD
jgi:hypothetical protein